MGKMTQTTVSKHWRE